MIDSVALNKNRMLSVLFLHSLMGMKMSQLVLLSFHIFSEILCFKCVFFKLERNYLIWMYMHMFYLSGKSAVLI